MKTLTSSRITGIAVFFVTFMLAANSFAALNAYLKIKGTKGEGTYQAKIDPATGDCLITGVPAGEYTATIIADQSSFTFHSSDPSTIEVSSFSWGVTNTSVSGSGLGAGKVSVSSFNVMKKTDMSSPSLDRESPTKGGFTNKACKLYIRKAGENPHEFYTITLDNIQVSGSGEELPKESLSRRASGGSPTSTHYDVKACVKI